MEIKASSLQQAKLALEEEEKEFLG